MGSYSKTWHSPETVADAALLNSRLAALRPALTRHFRRRMPNGNDVEDLVQEVFLRMLARQGGDVENLEGYAFQTAASVLADRHRRRTVRHADDQVPFDSDRHDGIDHDPCRIVESREALAMVVAEVDAFPGRTKKILIMRRLGGHSFKEIAQDIGISISAVEKRMVDADRRLRLCPAYGH